ncbi:MAG: ABC transporter permease subunit [Bryobacterales bacterium]|nr:ABC transporter permease subunit [Bryobacterales bacterium]
MAVYKRTYKAYKGALTAEWSRFLILPRYAWKTLFQQRFVTILYVLCFFYPTLCALAIYLNNNLGFLAQYIPIPKDGLFEVSGRFFVYYTNIQGVMAFILTAFIGPGLISPDLANGGLPLYFCRPFSRTEYVVGKMVVVAGLLSKIMWIPALGLWALQAALAGGNWWRDNLWLVGAIVGSSAVWILLITFLALALSAWVRWRVVAGALLLVVFFLFAGLGQAVNAILRTEKGTLLDPGRNLEYITMELFRRELPETASFEESMAAVALMVAGCIWLLARKVRAHEVVR